MKESDSCECPNCGSVLRPRTLGSSQLLECDDCGVELATTSLHVQFDEKRVLSLPPQSLSPRQLIEVAHLSGQNALQVRSCIESKALVLATDYFDVLDRLRARLDKVGVKYTVTEPEAP